MPSGSRRLGVVADLWRFPVNSFGGERLRRAFVGPFGLIGDRRYAVDAGEGPVTARRTSKLLSFRAGYGEGEAAEHPTVTLPDGEVVPIGDTGLLAALGRRVDRLLADRESLPRVEYARGLAQLAQGGRPAAGLLARSAAAIAADGWGFESARMLLIGADAVRGASDGRDESLGLADAARVAFNAMGLMDWCRRAEEALRRARTATRIRDRPGGGGLSGRELEVLRLVAEGASNRDIAEQLVIAEKTAARHVANIFVKLGARRRADAVRIAMERGLLTPLRPPT